MSSSSMRMRAINFATLSRMLVSQVLGTGTGKFRVDWISNTCLKDCDVGGPLDTGAGTCGGLVTEPWITLHPTAEACCETHLYWIPKDVCTANLLGTVSFTDQWYIDWTASPQMCVKDCDDSSGMPCAGNPSPDSGFPTDFWSTHDLCCAKHLWWMTTAECKALTLGSGTASATASGTASGTCSVDSDCGAVCSSGTCSGSSTITMCPTCSSPKTVPDACEVEILIDFMDAFASANRELVPRWLRSSFHDAGTFNQNVPEGGANGCLITEPAMRDEPENFNLDSALNTLEAIMNLWTNHDKTCIDVSFADLIQFAGYFAVIRQMGTPGLDQPSGLGEPKRVTLIDDFQWGRPDETSCDLAWTLNLPGFFNSFGSRPMQPRCQMAGKEIEEKMMNRNGFTAMEATALIGAHTIGLVRDTFGRSLAGPWVENGADDATDDGPVFDNAYHEFLADLPADTCVAFSANPSPFDGFFPNWFRVNNVPSPGKGLDHLDTDIALAFEPLQDAHPSFHLFTNAFAADQALFIEAFMQSLVKMSNLGVDTSLLEQAPTTCACSGRRRLSGASRSLAGISNDLSPADYLESAKALGDATGRSTMSTIAKQNARMDELKNLTEPIADFGKWDTSGPTPTVSYSLQPSSHPAQSSQLLRGPSGERTSGSNASALGGGGTPTL